MRFNRTIKAGTVALVLVAVFGAGAGAAWLSFDAAAPKSLRAPAIAKTAAVFEQRFSDERSVQVTFTTQPAVALTTGISGRVTTTSCSAQSTMQSGQVLLNVDEDPIVLLATSIPLWRDISLGDKGDDVSALQTELQRLGYSYHGTAGVAGTGTIRAATQLLHAEGEKSFAGNTVPAATFAWIPTATVRIASCPSPVGTTLDTDNILATLAGTLTRASIAQLPAGLVPGARDLEVDDVTVPIGKDGVVSDGGSLAKLASTESYAQYLATSVAGAPAVANGAGSGSGTTSVAGASGKLVLTHELKIGVVPPSAVYSISANKGCVLSPERAYAVSLVGSQLGQTYVQFDSDKQPASVEITPQRLVPCR